MIAVVLLILVILYLLMMYIRSTRVSKNMNNNTMLIDDELIGDRVRPKLSKPLYVPYVIISNDIDG